MNQVNKLGKGVAATVTGVAAHTVARGVGAVRRRATFGPPARRGAARDVHAVTVTVPPEQLVPGSPALAPLERFGDAVQVTVRPAPGDRGSEVHVRIVRPAGVVTARAQHGEPPGEPDHGPDHGPDRGPAADALPEAAGAVRAALRELRALAEIGFVPSPDRPTTTVPTPLNAPLREITTHGREGGRL